MRYYLEILILLTAPALFQVAGPSNATAQTTSGETKIQAPDHVVYEFYFRRIAFLNDLAAKKEREGLSGDSFRFVIQNELGINDTQRYVLDQVCSQALQAVASLDAKAAAIIQNEHARYPEGRVSSKDKVPSVPRELTELQAARNSTFINAKAQLADAFGAATFKEVDSRIRSTVSPSIVPAPRR